MPTNRDDNSAAWPADYRLSEVTLHYTLPNPYGDAPLERTVHGYLATPNAVPPRGGYALTLAINGHHGPAVEPRVLAVVARHRDGVRRFIRLPRADGAETGRSPDRQVGLHLFELCVAVHWRQRSGATGPRCVQRESRRARALPSLRR